MPAESRGLTAGRFALELDHVPCGFVKSFRGGSAAAEVITERVAPNRVAHKRIAQPRYDPIELQFGFSMAKSFYDWIADSWKHGSRRKSGSIVVYDSMLHPLARRSFADALIVETTVPTLSASSKDPAYMTLKVAPEIVRAEKPGKAAASPPPIEQPAVFLPSNFRLAIDGVDCTKIARIEGFSVTQGPVEDAVAEFPNLRVTFAAVTAQTWRDWFDDFVIRGNNGDDRERNGTLTLLAPDRKDVLATITLRGLGIFRLDEDWTAAEAHVHHVGADLYCERMEFAIGAPVATLVAEPPSMGARVTSMFRR